MRRCFRGIHVSVAPPSCRAPAQHCHLGSILVSDSLNTFRESQGFAVYQTHNGKRNQITIYMQTLSSCLQPPQSPQDSRAPTASPWPPRVCETDRQLTAQVQCAPGICQPQAFRQSLCPPVAHMLLEGKRKVNRQINK